MVPELRQHFNSIFSAERHAGLVADAERRAGAPIQFHLAETPCFFAKELMDRLIDASQTMVHQLLSSRDYRQAADAIVPERFRVAHSERLPAFLQVDFGLVETGGTIEGRLVELQAFASLYGFQLALAESFIAAYGLTGVTPFLGTMTHDAYMALMRRTFVGPHDPSEVVLLEIDPLRQKTLPDFVVTEQWWGVRAIDVRSVVKKGRELYYDRDGKQTRIRRVYNRVIPDELDHKHIQLPFDYRDDIDVEWLGGPDWFFRISKFSIPWIEHAWVPPAKYLHQVGELPADRERYLLKPLFSFSGGGIIFAPTDAQIAAIPTSERHLYLLQKRVEFTPVIATPQGMTKAEVRIMMVRDGDAYLPVLPLIRMGRGKMMGVDFNKGQLWVGAAAGLQETR
jgi:hypothetical protein